MLCLTKPMPTPVQTQTPGSLFTPVFAQTWARHKRGVPNAVLKFDDIRLCAPPNGRRAMTDYNIAAIPTLYRGRRYRSRLEARWAAFFDLLGWRHEYEPFDLGSWSPDFLLTEWATLVEIKPADAFDPVTWDRMRNAVIARQPPPKDDDDYEEGGVRRIFLSRVAPHPISEDAIEVGWMGFHPDFRRACRVLVGWSRDYHRPIITAELVAIDRAGWYTASGDAAPWPWIYGVEDERHPLGFAYGHHTMELWARASSTVQWLGKGAQP